MSTLRQQDLGEEENFRVFCCCFVAVFCFLFFCPCALFFERQLAPAECQGELFLALELEGDEG